MQVGRFGLVPGPIADPITSRLSARISPFYSVVSSLVPVQVVVTRSPPVQVLSLQFQPELVEEFT